MRSSGPSESYAGRIRARVRPNIVFTEDITGNPTTDVEVRTAPDGTIVGQRILKSSGVRSWDDAVLKAVIKTEILPRDVDGRVHSPLIISFRAKD
jgi:colicin import membrane protein